MSDATAWKVYSHSPIQKLEDNLWLVTGSVPNMGLKRIMTVFRMSDGRLVINSAIAMEEEAMRELEAFGEPAFLIVPNGFHRLDGPRYKARYPQLTVLCPVGSHQKVAERVVVDGHLEAFPKDPAVAVEYTAGTKEREGVWTVKSGPDLSRTTLIFNDCIFNLPDQPGFQGLITRLIGSSGGPKVTRIARLALVADKKALRSQLERLADTPGLARLIPGHGFPVTEDPAGTLRRIATTL